MRTIPLVEEVGIVLLIAIKTGSRGKNHLLNKFELLHDGFHFCLETQFKALVKFVDYECRYQSPDDVLFGQMVVESTWGGKDDVRFDGSEKASRSGGFDIYVFSTQPYSQRNILHRALRI